jgi:hypothetical protein
MESSLLNELKDIVSTTIYYASYNSTSKMESYLLSSESLTDHPGVLVHPDLGCGRHASAANDRGYLGCQVAIHHLCSVLDPGKS